MMSCGIHPFWFWNADMDEATICEQIRMMHEQEISGFVLCARQGLTIPYLSQKWFDLVRCAVEEAKKYEMVVWLYDEQPYPSGISGGKVVLDHPEFEAKRLAPHIIYEEIISHEQEIQIELEWGKPLYAKAFPVMSQEQHILLNQGIDLKENIGSIFREEVYHESGLTAYNRKRFLACDPYYRLEVKLPPGCYKIIVFMEVPVRGHKYFDYFVDPLNANAVDYFIETTHTQYKKHLGEFFGETIKGFFTDEIHPTGYEDQVLPWSPQMPRIYHETTGRNLLDELPALFLDGVGDVERIRQDFYTSLVDEFIESYDKKMLAWCHENHLQYIGEKPILRSEQLAYMDIPGIDAGHQKVGTTPEMFSQRYRANGKIVASAAHFYHKEYALCEAFHSIGWGLEIQDMKWTYDWLLLQGVTMFVNHAYYSNAQGLAKHDAPPSGFFQMPWYQHQKQLSQYVKSITSAMDGGKRPIEVLLVDPIVSTWKYRTKQMREKRLSQFEQMQQALFLAGYDFYIMDPRLLEHCTKEEDGLRYEKQLFKVVVGPDEINVKKVLEQCQLKHIPRYEVLQQGMKIDGIYAIAWEKEGDHYHFVVNTADFRGQVELVNQDGQELSTFYIRAFESVLIINQSVKQAYAPQDKRTWTLDLEQACAIKRLKENALRIDTWELTLEGQSHTVKAKPIIDQLADGGFMLPLKRQDRFGTPKQLLFPTVYMKYGTYFFLEVCNPIKLRVEKKGICGQWSMLINGHGLTSENILQEKNYTKDGYEVDITSYLCQGLNTIEVLLEAKKSWEGIRTPIYLLGDFSVHTKNGRFVLCEKRTRGKLGQYQAMGIPHYVGDIQYSYTVTGAKDIDWLSIDDPKFQQSAMLIVNGQNVGVRTFSPYVWNVENIWKKGENRVEIIASTTRLGYYEDQHYIANHTPYGAYVTYERDFE